MVGLVFSISNFFMNKIYQANKLSMEKNAYMCKPGLTVNLFKNNILFIIRFFYKICNHSLFLLIAVMTRPDVKIISFCIFF